MNEAVKTKWLWRFATEDDALWKKVIICKDGAGSLDGVRGALMHIGLDVENLSIQVWIFLSLLFVLRWEMGLGCFFGMISGAGNILSFDPKSFQDGMFERCHSVRGFILEWKSISLGYYLYKKFE